MFLFIIYFIAIKLTVTYITTKDKYFMFQCFFSFSEPDNCTKLTTSFWEWLMIFQVIDGISIAMILYVFFSGFLFQFVKENLS